MVSICVICMIKEPPLTPLNSEHRQLLEAIVSPVINTTEIKPYQLLHCVYCKVLLQSLYNFQQTALRGVQNFKYLLSKHHEQITASCYNPIPEAKPDLLIIKIEPENEPVTKEEFISVSAPEEPIPLEEVDVKYEPATQPDYDSESTISCSEPEEMVPEAFAESEPLRDIKNELKSAQVTKVVIPISVSQQSQETQEINILHSTTQPVKIVPSSAQSVNYLPPAKKIVNIAPSTKRPVNIAPSTKVLRKLPSEQQIVNVLSSKNIANIVEMVQSTTPVKIVPSTKRPVQMVLSGETPNNLPKKLVKIAPTTMTGNIVQATTGNVGRTGPIGHIVPTTTTGRMVPSTRTGRMVPSTSTGNIVRTGRIGNIVPTTTTGRMVPSTRTGNIVRTEGMVPSTKVTTKEAVAMNAAKLVQKEKRFEVFTHSSDKTQDLMTQEFEQARNQPYISNILWKNGVHEPRRTKIYKKPERVPCPECEKTCSSKEALNNHFNRIHAEANPVNCKICNRVCRNEKVLQYHMSISHSKKKIAGEHINPEWFCVKCTQQFYSKSTFKQHLMSLKHVPREQLPFECDICKKKFSDKGQIRVHIVIVHLNKKNHECDKCDKRFVSKSRLRAHIAKQHDKKPSQRPHVCHICGKAFTVAKSLREHLLMHQGLRPFTCKLCPATFTYSAALFTHNRLKHLKIKGTWKKKGKKQENKEGERGEKNVEQGEKNVEQGEKRVEQVEKSVEQREKSVKQGEKSVKQKKKGVVRGRKRVKHGGNNEEQEEKDVEHEEKAVEQKGKDVEQVEKDVEHVEKHVTQDSLDIDQFFNKEWIEGMFQDSS